VDEAIVAATKDSPELALIDLRMPGRSGLHLIVELKAIDATTNVVVLTGYGSIATALEAVRLGATHYLTKPADLDEILAAFARTRARGEGLATIEHEVASLARAEWEHIHRVFTDCSGNVSQAARLLGIHRRSLQRKLAKYPVAR
jgi:two-component system response regulator RegA